MPLPPRKFYTLQQAADKLSRDFKELVTIEDLLHYWAFDDLDLSIYFSENHSSYELGGVCINKHKELIDTSIFFKSEPPEEINYEFFKYTTIEKDIFEIIEYINGDKIPTKKQEEKEQKTRENISFANYSGFFRIISTLEINNDIKK